MLEYPFSHPVCVFSQYQFSHLTPGLLISLEEESQSFAGLVRPSVHWLWLAKRL